MKNLNNKYRLMAKSSLIALASVGAMLLSTSATAQYYSTYGTLEPVFPMYPTAPQGSTYPNNPNNGYRYESNPAYQGNTNIGRYARPEQPRLARVISATPIVATENNPVNLCTPAQIVRPNTNGSGALIGALAGGIIGNSIGGHGRYDRWGGYHSRNNGAGAVVGAIGGALVGNSIEANSNPSYYRPGNCYTQNNLRPVITGYDVRYELNNQIYTTQTVYHPGEWINLNEAHLVGVPNTNYQPAYNNRNGVNPQYRPNYYAPSPNFEDSLDEGEEYYVD